MKVVACLALAGLALAGLPGCRKPDDAKRLVELRRVNEGLHSRLEQAVGRDPIAARAFSDPGQVVVAVRFGLIEELGARIAREYLDHVTLDLSSVDAWADGKIRAQTLLGRKSIGDWGVEVVIRELSGRVRAGRPRLRLASTNLLQFELPVDVSEATGRVSLRLFWDSASLANVVCKDFDLSRELQGRVLPQRHTLTGTVRLTADHDSWTATPVLTGPGFRLKVDLTPESWSSVESALRSEDTLGRCGLLLKPEKLIAQLKGLAAEGFLVKLNASLFHAVQLPARIDRSVRVNDRVVELALETETLQLSRQLLWSSASMRIAAAPRPDAKSYKGTVIPDAERPGSGAR